MPSPLLSLIPPPPRSPEAGEFGQEKAAPKSGVRLKEARPLADSLQKQRRVGSAEVESHLPEVRRLVSLYGGRLPAHVSRDDILAAATKGLHDALRRPGLGRGKGFRAYLRLRVRGAIVDELRRQDWLPRRLRAEQDRLGVRPSQRPAVVRLADLSLGEQVEALRDEASPDPAEAVVARNSLVQMLRRLDSLPPREAAIVRGRYFEGRKFREMSKELGVSEARVSQLHARALARMRKKLESAD